MHHRILTLLIYYLHFYFSCILVLVRTQFNFGHVHYLFIWVVCTFSSFNNDLVLLCVIFLTYMCCPWLCSHGGWLLLKCSAIGIGFNGVETNCGIARILGIFFECMMFKALIAKWKVYNISYGASGKPWRHFAKKSLIHSQ